MTGLLAFASAVLAVAGLGLLVPAGEPATSRRALGFAARLGGRLRPGACRPESWPGGSPPRARPAGSACAT